MRCGSCKGSHGAVADVRACYAEARAIADEIAGEIYAEAVMSWVARGGSPEDAVRYAAAVARGERWNGGVGEVALSGRTCEHGLAAELCEGPQHYPMDM